MEKCHLYNDKSPRRNYSLSSSFSGIFSPCKRHDPCSGLHAHVRVVQERDGPGWIPLPCVCLPGNFWINQSTLRDLSNQAKYYRSFISVTFKNLLSLPMSLSWSKYCTNYLVRDTMYVLFEAHQ